MNEGAAVVRVREALDRHGILPAHDAMVPSVSNLVAGRPIRGSWWGDPAGRQIYLVLNTLGDEVAWPKLLGGKVTLVHRRLWAALAAVGEQEAPWQTEGLGDVERSALQVVREAGATKTDELRIPAGTKPGKIVTELERRLLVIADQEHTEAGHHLRTVRTWAEWLKDPRPGLEEATAALDAAADSLGARDQLPWAVPAAPEV